MYDSTFSSVIALVVAVCLVTLSVGCNLDFDVDEVPFHHGSDAGDVGCEPESDSELQSYCEEQQRECGTITVTDSCDEERTLECGSCDEGEHCQQHQCLCLPESNQELCDSHHPDACGVIEFEDRCEEIRYVDCGGCGENSHCGDGQICQGCGVDCDDKCGMVPDGCGAFVDCSDSDNGISCSGDESCQNFECVPDDCSPVEECEPEYCGQIIDGCGGLVDCDTICGDEELCLDNSCECAPESDEELCDNQNIACGVFTATDRCGIERSIDCEDCPSNDVCEDNQCIPPECKGRDLQSDFENCGECGNRCDASESCVEGVCEPQDCTQNQGDISGSCDFFSGDDCEDGKYCSFQLGSGTFFQNCLDPDTAGEVQEGEDCGPSDRCDTDLYCIAWDGVGSTQCAEICRRQDHQGCAEDQYCLNPFNADDELTLEEMGVCHNRCSPQDDDACPGGRRCTADPVFPEGTCHANFRCMLSGGSSGKAEGDNCNRKSLHDDGCPSSLSCAPVGPEGQDRCVRPCRNSEDCSSPEQECVNADSPWQALRYCSPI